MKIVEVKTFTMGFSRGSRGRNWSFVKLVTDEGIEGVGEVGQVHFAAPAAGMMIEDMAKEVMIGADPHNIEKLWTLLYCSRNCEHPDLTRLSIIGALEMACWRPRRLPVWERYIMPNWRHSAVVQVP